MEKTLESTVKVRFQDCDPFSHLCNSKYLDYFVNAREDQIIEHYDLDVYKHMKETGNGWLISLNQISYIKPALAHEELVIRSKLIKQSSKVLLIEFEMWDKNQTHLKAFYWTQFIYFNVEIQRTVSHNDKLMELFKNIVSPIEQTNFEERSRYVFRNSRKSRTA